MKKVKKLLIILGLSIFSLNKTETNETNFEQAQQVKMILSVCENKGYSLFTEEESTSMIEVIKCLLNKKDTTSISDLLAKIITIIEASMNRITTEENQTFAESEKTLIRNVLDTAIEKLLKIKNIASGSISDLQVLISDKALLDLLPKPVSDLIESKSNISKSVGTAMTLKKKFELHIKENQQLLRKKMSHFLV